MQGFLQQMGVAVALAGQLVAQKAGIRPAHMRIAALPGRLQQPGRGFATGCAKQRQRRLPGQGLQTSGSLVQVVAILWCTPQQVLTGLLARTGADAKAHITRTIEIGTPISVVPGVRGKGMAFGPPCTPPIGPVITQGAITLLGFFIRRKKSDRHFVALQHLGNQRGGAHVAGVEGQVDRAVAGGGFCRDLHGQWRLRQYRAAGQGAQRQAARRQPLAWTRLSCAAHGPRSKPRGATCPPALA